MTPDRMDQTIRLKDGRALGYAEYGNPEGKVVFHFNGSGGCSSREPLAGIAQLQQR